MESKMPPNKTLQDIADCVYHLKRESLDGKTPINDDSATLHHFQEKLELILQFGLIEKPSLLGPKKSYWNYICACFTSKKNHDGILFVKSIIPLRTHLGRGRAFIRFCLVQKCLADTLQCCFMNQRISREFYSERSFLVQEKLWSFLVTLLYELNELNFVLSTEHTELDSSWPKFARKLLTSSESLSFLQKDMSADMFHSLLSRDQHNITRYSYSKSLTTLNLNTSSNNLEVITNVPELSDHHKKLPQENMYLQQEVKCLKEEKLKLQIDIQNLKLQFETLQQQMNLSFKGNCNESEMKKALSSRFTFIEPKDHFNVDVDEVKKTGSCDNDSFTEVPSVKPKIKNAEGDTSECISLQGLINANSMPVTDTFNLYGNNSEDLQMRTICLPQNYAYISELLFEFKTVIDDIEDITRKSEVPLVVPHISRLKRISGFIKEIFLNQFDKSKSHLNFNNYVENCVSCIKTFTTKQEDVINSLQEKVNLSINQNKNIYSRITALKTLLGSYGFLKLSNEKEIISKSLLLPFDINSTPSSIYESFSCDSIAHDPILKRIIVPLMPVLNLMFLKVHDLNAKMAELQFGLDSSYELINSLITRVQDQKIHLKGVTKELEEAKQLVSVLKKQHRKLQSAEGILKYDLQEKRKLLTRLRQQLENTREDFNIVHIKNSKSEAEWQDLHKEFVQRHKQTSKESGSMDDKVCEEYDPSFSTSRCDSRFSEENTTECILNNNESKIVYEDVPIKKSRLDLLEEQCQNLYSSLLQGSKKHQDIDKHLEIMCNAIEKSNNGCIHSRTLLSDLPSAHRPVDINDTSDNTSSEDICQHVVFSSDNFNSSPHSSSDVGSLNSECSSCVPGIFNDTNSCDSCCCSSSKTDSCISLSPFKLQIGDIQNLSTMEQYNEDNSLLYSNSASACNLECKNENASVLSCEYMELSGRDVQSSKVHNLSLYRMDSLLIKENDLEKGFKILEMDSELLSDKKSCLDTGEFAKQIEALEEEKRLLLNKIQDFEKKTLIISTELDNTKQQLILSKAAKEHEVAALQFQLNTEAIKYESALKGFSEQNKGLGSMKEKITDQEKLILALEEALTEIQMDCENEKKMQWQELEDIHIAFEAREQECIALSQDLEKCLYDVQKEKNKNELLLSQLEDLKVYSIRYKESMDAQLLHLQNDSKALKKKLIKLLKEKDLLWKRNNHLYHIQKVKYDDRWMNDSEVSNCLGCRNNFSFLIRKHHCRLCGRIFCYSCSNNWLLTASSSKKIRACNECFMQHFEMKKDVRRGSDIPQVEDDSGDEHNNVDLSFIPMSNESFTSAPSSVTDSVVSLPITLKQSTPQFASAPDLRYVIRPDDISLISALIVQENVLEESNEELLFSNRNKELADLNATDISSDDCTSITLEEDIPRINRLKDISIDEIKAFEHGLSREFIIPPGENTDLPIYCQTYPMVVKWCFISSCQDIPITITYTDKECNNEHTLCFEDKHMMQDEMEISLPGYYVFHFDNSYRPAEVKIQYNILLKPTAEVESSFQN